MTNPKMKMTKMTLTTLTTNQNTIRVTEGQARCDVSLDIFVFKCKFLQLQQIRIFVFLHF